MHKGVSNVSLFLVIVMLCSCSAQYEYTVLDSYDEIVYTRESAGIRLEDDFYGYTNFDFLWNNEIPSDMPEYSSLEIISYDIDKQLTKEITSIIQNSEGYIFGSDEQKIRDFYIQYINTEERNEKGLCALDKGIRVIESAENIDDFVAACGVLYRDYGCSVLLSPYVSEDYYDNSKYSLYLGQMDLMYSAEELLYTDGQAESVQELITMLFLTYGTENPEETAYNIVDMLLKIAEKTTDISELSIREAYNEYTKDELQNLFTNIDTGKMAESYGIDFAEEFVIYDIEQAKTINGCLCEEYLDLWKSYALCRLFYEYRDYLPDTYREIFYTDDYMSIEERAVSAVKTELSGEVGNIYSNQCCDEEAINAAFDLTVMIKNAYGGVISESESLDEEAKEKLLLKLEKMVLNIGYPNEDYHSDSVVLGSLIESCVSIKSTRVLENLSLYSQNTDKEVWEMTPQTVNAVYSMNNNSITVPAALLQSPIFDKNGDLYENLGGLGTIIAHEMTHAFDEEGMQFDEKGCYNPDWAGVKDKERIEKIKESVEEYFGNIMIMDSHYIDGEQTVNENLADLGAMHVIASITDDKVELQKIFNRYAILWATLSYDTVIAEQLFYDVHSPAEIRVNGVLSATDKFYYAYDITEEDGMYVPPEDRARVW